jgi:C-terminal processing protease CtpA/Prc
VDTITLSDFLATNTGKLSLAERQQIVDEALDLLEQFYVHLPQKQTMHAIRPTQKLKLLQYRMSQMSDDHMPSEMQFHREMIDIFTSLRDLHTNYALPDPFNKTIAFLPFHVEEYFEGDQRKYMVSKIAPWFNHPPFEPGVEVFYWNGVPIAQAVEINADRIAGSNLEARYARGLESLTYRPMFTQLPPDEEWVILGYRALNGTESEIKQPWLVLQPQAATDRATLNATSEEAVAFGIDIQGDAIQQVKKILFAPQAVALEEHLADANAQPIIAQGLDSTLPHFRAKVVKDIDNPDLGYIRIFSFSVPSEDQFIAEFIRLLNLLPQDGLIVDVRGNPGGLIYAAERLLQLLTPRHIEPERFEFINTTSTLELCRQNAPSPFLGKKLDLSPWVGSIAQAVETGAVYSSSYSMTSVESCNSIGQQYFGPVVLIIDALCYSATDIFTAGFQDHEIGPVLGASGNTGAGGANVWSHGLLQSLMSSAVLPPKQLPKGTSMRVSIRRSTRVGKQLGTLLEDLGVTPDYRHHMTKNDLLNDNIDLINQAVKILADLPVRQLSVDIDSVSDGTLTATVNTKSIARLDIYLDKRPQQSLDISADTTQITVELRTGASVLEVQGYESDRLVAVRRSPIVLPDPLDKI